MKTAAQIQGLVLSGATVAEVGAVLGLRPMDIGRILSLAASTQEDVDKLRQKNQAALMSDWLGGFRRGFRGF